MMDTEKPIAILVPIFSCLESEFQLFLDDVVNQSGSLRIKIYFVVEEHSNSFDLPRCCEERLREIAQIDYQFFFLSGHKGLGYALNFGLSQIHEDLVVRQDIGDRMSSNRLCKIKNVAKQNLDAVVFYSQAYLIKNGEAVLSKSPASLRRLKMKLAFSNPIIHPTVALNLASLRRLCVNYDNNLRFCEDLDLWLRLIKNNQKFVLIDEPLVSYVRPLTVRKSANWSTNLQVRWKNFGSPNMLLSIVGVLAMLGFVLMPPAVKSFLYAKR